VITLLVLAVCGYAIARSILPPSARAFVTAQANPINPVWHNGDWWWIEKKDGSRLVRASGTETHDAARAEEIDSFSVTGDNVVWASRNGKQWSISVATTGGGSARKIADCDQKPSGVFAAKDQICWSESVPPPFAGAETLPPLGATSRILSAPLSGGPPKTLCSVLEGEIRQVLGVHGDMVYFVAIRPGGLGSTAIYSAPVSGGAAGRVAAAAGKQTAVLTRDGILYWVTSSRETSSIGTACAAKRLGPNGKVEVLTDWLPYGGRLVETDRGVYYLDDTYESQAWRIGVDRDLPRPLRNPESTAVIGAGGSELLLKQIGIDKPTTIPISRMALP
jgi:hypothetical protein